MTLNTWWTTHVNLKSTKVYKVGRCEWGSLYFKVLNYCPQGRPLWTRFTVFQGTELLFTRSAVVSEVHCISRYWITVHKVGCYERGSLYFKVLKLFTRSAIVNKVHCISRYWITVHKVGRCEGGSLYFKVLNYCSQGQPLWARFTVFQGSELLFTRSAIQSEVHCISRYWITVHKVGHCEQGSLYFKVLNYCSQGQPLWARFTVFQGSELLFTRSAVVSAVHFISRY